jgi:hypothetical protein
VANRLKAVAVRSKKNTSTNGTPAKAVVDDVRAWMRQHFPGRGVDALLVQPYQAMLMGLAIGVERDRIDADAKLAITSALSLVAKHPGAFDAINDVCRAAMNGRKQGKLKPLRKGAKA